MKYRNRFVVFFLLTSLLQARFHWHSDAPFEKKSQNPSILKANWLMLIAISKIKIDRKSAEDGVRCRTKSTCKKWW